VPRFEVIRLGRVGSTNEVALELARKGEGDRTLVVAAEQTAGRGRHGRRWQSPRGNFYGSLVLRTDKPLGVAATLSLVLGLVVVQSLERLAGRPLDLSVKWPNDVQLHGAKLAGILLEATSAKGASWIVAGVGVNLASAPRGADRPAASLAAIPLVVDPEGFLGVYLEELGRELPLWERKGFVAFRDRWLARAAGIGRRATLRIGDERHEGQLLGLGEDGTLALRTGSGAVRHFTTGELFFGPEQAGLSVAARSR
jgi:BirA family biotin operon repressor/biotin-[acetyl-CoA-carboxylase] ligase